MTTPIPSFTCPRCNRTSYHPDDVDFGYCGACHAFTGERWPGRPRFALDADVTVYWPDVRPCWEER